MLRFVLSLFLLLQPLCSYCISPTDKIVLSKEQEKQAHHIFSMVRCVSCQGETVKESDALLSKAMRQAIRKKIQDGQSEEQILNFIRQRYGDYVILSPHIQGNTLALWVLPCLIILLGIFIARRQWIK